MSSAPSLLAVDGVDKSFLGTQALADFGVRIDGGEIHALVGHNGSGKSTLIKILAGYHKPDAVGAASYRGEPFELGSAAAARAHGIRFVHQDLGLISQLSAVDNLALGERYVGQKWLSDRRERGSAERVLDDYGIHIDVDAPIGALSIAQQTMIAIVRGLNGSGDSQLLVLDEPTAALPAHDVRQLFELLEQVRARGGSVLYVTHRLSELFDLADRVTVLRNGRVVRTVPIRQLTHDSLVEAMIGAAPEAYYQAPPEPRSDLLLTVEGLSGEILRDVGFGLHRGEILGVTGLVGSGYDELLSLMFGARRRIAGRVRLLGESLSANSPNAAIRAGVAYASADRRSLSGIAEWTLRENVTLPEIPSRGPGRWLARSREAASVRPWLLDLGVLPPDGERAFKSLSGGNQQKVVLARWLRCRPVVLLLDEPTSGIDTPSKHAIYKILASTAKKGSGVLVASSDAEELAAICDRVVVLRDGRVGSILDGSGLSTERILAETMRAKPPGLSASDAR